MRLTLTHHPDGISTSGDLVAVYDIDAERAHFGEVSVDGPALMWELHSDDPIPRALLSVELSVDHSCAWLLRCDRIDFPPRAVAHPHTHPGPGIRCLLFGRLTVETEGTANTYGRLGAWFENGPTPVRAVAGNEKAAFARVMLLPRQWEGRRTIRYVDEADALKPKQQRATVFFEYPVEVC